MAGCSCAAGANEWARVLPIAPTLTCLRAVIRLRPLPERLVLLTYPKEIACVATINVPLFAAASSFSTCAWPPDSDCRLTFARPVGSGTPLGTLHRRRENHLFAVFTSSERLVFPGTRRALAYLEATCMPSE